MVTASDIVRDGWSAVPGAIFWLFVVWGLGKAVFRGFWAQELRLRLDRRHARQLDAIRQAQWELRTGRRFDSAAVRSGHPAIGPQAGGQPVDDDMAASPLLTDVELADRRSFLARQVNATIWLRALRYLLACPFCQTFWSATLCFLAASLVGPVAPSPWLNWLPTCLAYAGAAVWLLDRNASPIHAMTTDAGGSPRPLSTEAGRACAGCATR